MRIFSKKTISIGILLLINFLFSFKYLTRYTDFALIITLVISSFYWGLLNNTIRLKITDKKFKRLVLGLVISYFIVAIFIFSKINVSTLNVDRWSVVTSFWDAAFTGNYPYYAESHMGNKPGPMPVYFLLTLSFYLLNELGYFSLIGFIVLTHLIIKLKAQWKYKFLIIIFILTSTYYLWEIVSRSNIFTNSVLILWFLLNYSEHDKREGRGFYLNAIIAGLLLSTRAIFIIPFIIFFVYDLRKRKISFPKFLIFVSIAVITFLLTFLPFIILYPNDFFKINPFIIQSSFLVPVIYTYFFILMAFVFSFLTKSITDLLFYSGLAFFLSIFIFFIYNIGLNGFQEFYIGKKVDISYFIFCIPFFIFHLLKKSENVIEEEE